MAAVVRYETAGTVAVLVIDNPPVNASTAAVRQGLLDGLARARDDAALIDSGLVGIVLVGGRHFVTGSDLREFDGPIPGPELPEVIAAIEAHPLPVVAALSGSTLGGGFELALGCDRRVALAGSLVGLPEVLLGMIPGAGGTQRTLRLCPPPRVLELVVGAEPIDAEQAMADGLVDEVVDRTAADLRARAIIAARTSTKRVLRELPVLGAAPGELEETARSLLARRGADPAVVAAIGAVLTGTAVPAREALRHERTEFTRLRLGPEAAARRHLFFARRDAARAARPAVPRQIRRVGVVGAGTMGAGIARAFAEAGADVVLLDRDESALARARNVLARATGPGSGNVVVGTGLAALAGADVVVEAVVEDHDVKAAVLAEVAEVVGPDVPLGTNTSYLDVDALAATLPDPSRLVGMHFLNPAHRTAVVEVVRGRLVSQDALDHAFSAARLLGKLPIAAGVCDGFIGNRIYNAYRHQCELLVEDGASPRAVDDALLDLGFAMGPFAVSDMSGLDIAWHARRRRDATRDPRERYPDVADRLVAAGRLGQKTEAGWYRYAAGSRTPLDDPEVARMIADSRAARGLVARQIPASEIIERVLVAMANETALLLAEGIAARPGDVDLMLTLGYGFPARLGGICHWATTRPAGELAAAHERLATAAGPSFRAGDLALLT